MDKKGFEFSFGWLFAIIVGAIILFIAIYAATGLVKNERSTQDSLVSQQLEIILSPVEASIESEKSTKPIIFPVETRIISQCDTFGNFGSQSLSVTTKSDIGDKFVGGVPRVFYNKYAFLTKTLDAKEIYIFSKQFKMPFKIASLVFMWSDKQKYCFVNPPQEIEDEITDLQLKISINNSAIKCPKNSIKVCFSNTGCDIEVRFNPDRPNSGSVKKGKKVVYYEDALLYGAIFSDSDMYECQVTRLMKRASQLASIYAEESRLISTRADGCSSSIQPDLINYAEKIKVNSSTYLAEIYNDAKDLDYKNKQLTSCKLWRETWED